MIIIFLRTRIENFDSSYIDIEMEMLQLFISSGKKCK